MKVMIMRELSPPPPPETPDAVTLSEAADEWRVSERTLRRRLLAGEVAGARKVQGAKGDEWRIPVASLDAMGYQRRSAQATAPAADTAPVDVPTELVIDVLVAQLDTWRDVVKTTNLQLQAAESDRRAVEAERMEAVAEAARMEERLAAVERERDAARERADALAADLDEVRARRRWWRR